MNANLFRLVFSNARGMWVPVWEGVRARCAGGGGGTRRKTKHVVLQMGAGTLLLMVSATHAELPVACGGACGVNGNLSWLSNGSAQILPTEVTATGSRLPIFQESQRAILNWQSFNIGAGNEVEFRQQFGADAAVLNRIHQGSASEILGSLKANGQVYLINQNGIIFGNGAQVNVGSLTASTLTIPSLDNADASDNWFIKGIFADPANTASHFEGAASGDVIIAAGATLESAKGGRIMILAPNIDNQGRIITPDGQALLAAGDKIYLQNKSDPALRGLLVEVTGTGGTMTNGGEISAPRGNVTLLGFAVNQQGRVSATTSVNANGSIRLLARDNTIVSLSGSDVTLLPTRAGSVTLGEGSITEVRPEVGDITTSVDQQKFNRSRVEIMGETITLAANSRILAPSGEVTLSAGLGVPAPGIKGTGAIVLGAGSVIDVAGLTGVALPMERNLLEVELRGEQLRDSPLQRDGILRGEKVIIDIRKGTPLADVSGYIDGVGKTVGERSVVGGNVTLVSDGDIITRENAVLDVSGGQITYADGYLNTTKLVSEGRVYDISEASPDRIYESFTDFTKEHRKWGITESWGLLGGSDPRGQFAAGYVEGMSAGTLRFIAPGLVLDGTLRGGVTHGVYQREIKTMPLAGTLIVGDAAQASEQTPDFRTPDVIFQASRTAVRDSSLSDNQPLVMSTGFLQQGGFGQARIYSNGRISVQWGVVLTAPAGGEITLVGRQVDVQGGMNAPAGTLKLQATNTIEGVSENVTLGEGATLLARGLWVNDRPEIAGDRVPSLALIDGGSISLAAHGDVILGAGSMIDVSGGAWLSASGSLKSGKGGDITLRAVGDMHLGGELQAYALTNGALAGKGGTLTLRSQEIKIQPELNAESYPISDHGGVDVLTLTPDFFQRGGFSKYDITGTTGMMITAGTQLWPQAKNRLLQRGNYTLQPSGSNIDDFSQVVLLPQDQRTPVSLSLNSSQRPSAGELPQKTGDVLLEAGVAIHADPGAQVALSSMGNLTVLGVIDAPAGGINLSIAEAPTNNGFISSQAIWLGPHSQLLSRGFAQLQENDRGQQHGQVLRGGTVQIDAQRGYVVGAAGSLIDVSGVAADLDLPTDSTSTVSQATPIAGDAGRVVLKAREGMLLDGDWLARAGEGKGASGGTLEVALNRPFPLEITDIIDQPPVPAAPLQIVISADDAAGRSREVELGAPIPDEMNGKALLSSTKVQYAGFDKATFTSRDEIQFQGDASISLKRSLILDAPAITASNGARATLNTAYFALGTDTLSVTTLPMSGDGTLDVQARWIDVTGNSVLHGFKTVNLFSSGDLRLRGTGGMPGSLSTAADLTLKADQIYPTTLSQFTLEIGNNDQGTLTVEADNGATPVLSAAGRLTLRAPNIVQRGVLKAPFGEIELDAADTLTLDAGSITSTSAEGQIIPFGATLLGGKDWVYNVNGSITQAIDTPPERRIHLTGTHIDVREGATLDLSGGGDLYATEFVPGPGGSKDVLDASNATNTYAIVPGLSAEFAPYDNALYQTSSLQPGDSVYLSGSEGLSAGVYALLPARYALLPGAFLVTPRAGSQDMLPGQSEALLNGMPVVAGYRTVAGTDIRDARWSGFAVRSGSSARQESEFKDSYASTFFNGQTDAQLTGDAGRLSINASQSLLLDGALLANHVAGARGAEVDITASKMAIVSRRSDVAKEVIGEVTGKAISDEINGVVQLEVDSLNNLGAASLLLGGTRQNTKAGVEIQVGAAEVVVQNDQDNPLTAPEIILVANDTLAVKSGSVIEGKGKFTGKSKNLVIGRTDDAATLDVDEKIVGDGALLRVSAGAQSDITRLNVERTRGVLEVEAGAVLRADASVALDATLDTRSQGKIEMVSGALSLGASRVSLGETATVADGLVLSNAALAALTGLARLDLRSYSSVDLYGDVVLGSVDAQTGQPQLTTLSIEAAELAGYQNTGKTAVITAGNFTFSNPGKVVSSNVADGNGNLVISATEVVLGDQHEDAANKVINGFDAVKIVADKEITFQGQGHIQVAGDLDLVASRLTGGIGADQAINATGQVNITPSAQAGALPAVATLGARLEITGKRITHAGNIELPSGILALAAEGTDAGDAVTLVSGSQTNMQGAAKTFGDVVAYAPGGRVTLTSVNGNVDIQAGALVDVSGTAAGGDAGALAVHATQGTTLIAGNVQGNAAAQSRSGSVALDTGTLADFGALNNALNAGGFGESRSVRVRHGDINVAGTDTVTAQHLKLVADDGKIDIQGTLDASANEGGIIGLYAKQNVTLNPNAQLDAHATGNGEQGGKVTLATLAGEITLDLLSEINVSGGENGKGGSVLLRVPRTDTNSDGADDDVAIAALAGTLTGASTVVVEGVKTYHANRISALDATVPGANFNMAIAGVDATAFNDTQSFITNNKANIVARLGNAALRVRPGIDIYNNGDLELADDWDLGMWRFEGEPGTLTLRAQGDLKLTRSLSDGFNGAPANANVQGGESWSYQLVAGADTASADTLALLPQSQFAGGNKGHVKLANNALVRTGTGDIDIAAGANIELGNEKSVIYTAGTPVAVLGGFTAPPASAGQAAGYTHDGGNITLTAQSDIKGAITKQFINEWLFRQAGANPSWWLRFDQFQQNIGALGGGNITVTAGRDVMNLSAVIPTTGRVSGAVPEARVLDIQGGGDLSITAGRNIQSGVYYVGRGHGELHADGAITGRAMSNQVILHPVLALGNGDFRVTAKGDVNLETVVNPTILPRGKLQNVGVAKPVFFTYDSTSAISLISLSGDTAIHNNKQAVISSINLKPVGFEEVALSIYPGTLTARALQGNILLKNRMVLAPAPHGNFELSAAQDVILDKNAGIVVSDADPTELPVPMHPQTVFQTINNNLGAGAATAHAVAPIHTQDDTPIRIIADTGSIIGNNAQLVFPKQSHFQAGQDIQDLRLESQNVRASDVTRLQAGRDIVYTTDSNSSRIILAGPGRLEMQAGRTVDLGAAYGVETIGNAVNPALAERGADVAVMAGVSTALDYASVLDKYLASYDYRDELAVFIRDRESDASLTRDQALKIFASETSADQADILLSVKQEFAQLDAYSQANQLFFNELRETGRKVTASGGDYQRGFDAIATLFPASNYQGDISLYLSQIKTTKGGNIDLWAPGGQVNAGLAIPGKDPNELGIVAVNEGSVHAFTRDDFIVNASRVFAMRGGDILMWSSQGDIDAGKGKKTALVIPPPTISVDSQGNVKTDFGNIAVGSGIRALTVGGIAAGDVDLIAPAGEVNAGDAGIGAAGNLNIAALRVVGADNIQVGGVSTGVPVADTGGLGSSLSGVSNLGGESKVADQVTQDMTNQAANPLKDTFKPSFLTVEVIGHGD